MTNGKKSKKTFAEVKTAGGTTKALQPKEWLDIEVSVRMVARRFASRSNSLILKGGRSFSITEADLVQHAWDCLMRGKPPFDPNRRTLFQYFSRRMEDEYKRVSRRAENDLARYNYFPLELDVGSEKTTRVENVVWLFDRSKEADVLDGRDLLIRFYDWLSSNHPDLYELACAISNDFIEAQEQAEALGKEINTIYAMRKRLKQIAKAFLQNNT